MYEQSAASSQRTFRDPAGSIEIRPDGAYRQVNPAYASDALAFLGRPIASRLVSAGHLISSTVLTESAFEATAPDYGTQPLLLHHPRVSFASYPWEWTPALWLSAAELTLNLCSDLLKEGWILKDATPLNVLFKGVQPLFVDLLSIQLADLKQPIWFAYGQFVRTFLLPMLAHTRLGWPLQVAMSRRDGFEPEEIYAALSWAQRLQQPALSAVTLPILLSGRAPKDATSKSATNPRPRTLSDPEITRQVLLKTLSGLSSHMRRVTPSHRESTWSDYVNTANHYSTEDHAAKRDFVSNALAVTHPVRVLDVGCNTGVYSMLAADAGAAVVSIDTDMQAVDRLCTALKGSGKNILPLCVDIAHPTPAAGWQNRETHSFLTRASGHFDTVMMLAVLHHLLLQSQIPLCHIASLCSTLTTEHLILEWVPPQDPMFRQLVRGRDALYAHLTENAFRQAFAPYFTVLRELTLPNGRILFHFSKRVP
jgi:SAM-dependent methyltransferase